MKNRKLSVGSGQLSVAARSSSFSLSAPRRRTLKRELQTPAGNERGLLICRIQELLLRIHDLEQKLNWRGLTSAATKRTKQMGALAISTFCFLLSALPADWSNVVVVSTRDCLGTVQSGLAVTLRPLAEQVSSTNIILRIPRTGSTDTNGVLAWTNVVPGNYTLILAASPPSSLNIRVPTNATTWSAAALVTNLTAQTVSGAPWDGRYPAVAGTNIVWYTNAAGQVVIAAAVGTNGASLWNAILRDNTGQYWAGYSGDTGWYYWFDYTNGVPVAIMKPTGLSANLSGCWGLPWSALPMVPLTNAAAFLSATDPALTNLANGNGSALTNEIVLDTLAVGNLILGENTVLSAASTTPPSNTNTLWLRVIYNGIRYKIGLCPE